MTYQQCCPCPVDLIVDLRPLTFERIEDDGHQAVYRGYYDDSQAPAKPVYAVTVTVASPGQDEEARTEIAAFLSEMLVGFVLTAPPPDEDPYDEDESEPFDVSKELLIEFELVRCTVEDTFGVTVAVQTTAEGRTEVEADENLTELVTGTLRDLALFVRRRVTTVETRAFIRGRLLRGKEHRYRAANGSMRFATVTSRRGRGSIRPVRGRPRLRFHRNGGSVTVRATTVIVHAASRRLVFELTGRFNKK